MYRDLEEKQAGPKSKRKRTMWRIVGEGIERESVILTDGRESYHIRKTKTSHEEIRRYGIFKKISVIYQYTLYAI